MQKQKKKLCSVNIENNMANRIVNTDVLSKKTNNSKGNAKNILKFTNVRYTYSATNVKNIEKYNFSSNKIIRTIRFRRHSILMRRKKKCLVRKFG